MTSSGRCILLTGGAGFIGSHLAEALLSSHDQLIVLDNLNEFYPSTRKRSNLEEVRRIGAFAFEEADIRDRARLQAIFTRYRPDAVIHLAALAGVRPSIEQPLEYESVNVAGTANILELCREFRVQKLIFGSSSSVYGATSVAPFSENHMELRPISPYATTKLSGELMCYTYAHLFGLPTICLRFFTVYGPRQRPDLAIHKFTALIESGKPLPVFGDGSTGRDYTYVHDIVDGILRSLEYAPKDPNGAPFEVFNLGNSHPVKLTELIAEIEQATGRKAVREQKPMQPGDVPLTWADISKSSRLLGYDPKVRLHEGLQRFVTWYRAANQFARS